MPTKIQLTSPLDMGVYTSDQTKKGWLTSILELGAWVGCLYSGFLAEIFSRKYAILMNTAVFIVGVIIQCTAVSGAGASSILAGRFITGSYSWNSGLDCKLICYRLWSREFIYDCPDV